MCQQSPTTINHYYHDDGPVGVLHTDQISKIFLMLITTIMFLIGPTTAQDVEITSISINPDQNPLISGNQSQMHIIPYDQNQNVNTTVDMSLNILIYNIFGETSYQLNLTRAPYTHTYTRVPVMERV